MGQERGREIRVIVADDQELFRRGLAMLLAAQDGIAVLGETGDGVRALDLALETSPDVVVLDLRLPGLNGFQICDPLMQERPRTRMLVLTNSRHEEDLAGAIRHGATGYLLKDATVDEVARAIREVVAGRAVISPVMTAALVSELRYPDGEAPRRLTGREIQVLRLVAGGMNNRDIGEHLFISENTVKNHVRNILDKLGLRSRVQAAMYAVREGLVGDH